MRKPNIPHGDTALVIGDKSTFRKKAVQLYKSDNPDTHFVILGTIVICKHCIMDFCDKVGITPKKIFISKEIDGEDFEDLGEVEYV